MSKTLHRTLAALWLALTLVGPAFAGEVETRADKQDVFQGETIQVLLRYRGDLASRPELAPLEADFDVLDVRTSRRTSVVNGVRDESVDWILTLAPRRAGVLSVPELRVGDATSAAFDVRVLDAAEAGSDRGEAGAPVLFEIEVDDDHPYVQGKVTLTARLLFDESIRDGALTEPELEGALLERSGEDRTTSVLRDGKRYTQVERQYALFPQESGKVRVPPMTFEATQRSAPDRTRRRSAFDDPFADFFDGLGSPFGSSLFDQFFDRGQRVRVRSNAIELDVQPKPQEAMGAWWLPARHVELVEKWEPDPPVFRVGEQVTRRIAIQALGLSGSQMPELELPAVKGLKQYPQPSYDDTLTSKGETVAVKQRDFVLLPTQPGELVLPAVDVEWWDIEADETRIASLPERKVQVLAADGSVVATAPPEVRSPSPPVAPAEAAAEPAAAGSGRGLLFGGLGAAGLLALVAVYVLRRKRSLPTEEGSEAPAAPTLRQAERSLELACTRQDAAAATAALVAVGRARWPQGPPSTPAELARRLGDEGLEDAIAALMRARFSSDGAGWDGRDLVRAYTRASKARHDEPGVKRREPLPALYPVP